MRVSELGEFALIRRLSEILDTKPPAELIVGIGDDCAVWQAGETFLLATTDTLVEGVHFSPDSAPWRDVGWKALAVNVSDIAAMGGEPLFALITLALPADTPVQAVDGLYAGMRECAAEYGVTVAGGDIVQATQVAVTVALIGQAQISADRPLLLRRDGARPGDLIAVTGTLGDSAAGLRRLREGATVDDPLVRAHLRPRPPLALAHEAARIGISCGIDVSDGLLQDIGHVCEMSKLGADVRAEALPLSAELRAAYPDQALALACGGGEDYQMVFVGPGETVEQLRHPGEVPLTIIGQMTDVPGGGVRLLDASGDEISLPPGWEHLRGQALRPGSGQA